MIEKICKKCKIEFNVSNRREFTAKYCSNACMGRITKIFKSSKIGFNCIECSTTFKVFPSKAPSAKYCSSSCRKIGVGKQLKGRKHSKEWCNNISKGHKISLKIKIKFCEICNKEMKIITAMNKKWCSKKCRYAATYIYDITCKQCREVFKSDNIKRLYCSTRCVCHMRSDRVGKQETSIEIKLEKFLNELSIEYKKQKWILNKTRVDFFVEPNIIVYADGDYWHALPGRKELDKEINDLLRKNNFTVLRFWEHDIHNNPTMVKDSLDLIKN